MSGWLSQIGGTNAPNQPTIITDVSLNRYTVTLTDDTIISNSPANLTLILPDAASNLGRVLTISAASLAQISSVDFNVFPQGVVVQAGSSIIPAQSQGKWVVLQAGNSGWYVIASG